MIKNIQYMLTIITNMKKFVFVLLLFICSIAYSQTTKRIITERHFLMDLEVTKLYHLEQDYELIAFSIYDLMRGISISAHCVDLNNMDVYIHTTFVVYDNVDDSVIELKKEEVIDYLYEKECTSNFINTYEEIVKMLPQL